MFIWLNSKEKKATDSQKTSKEASSRGSSNETRIFFSKTTCNYKITVQPKWFRIAHSLKKREIKTGRGRKEIIKTEQTVSLCYCFFFAFAFISTVIDLVRYPVLCTYLCTCAHVHCASVFVYSTGANENRTYKCKYNYSKLVLTESLRFYMKLFVIVHNNSENCGLQLKFSEPV